ncbi:competence protein CoiA [Weissella koreensis]|uniref:competence protein CoiA n=1 Tax=Weissella koreensis TaxID=165096 RepID=UPI002FD79433
MLFAINQHTNQVTSAKCANRDIEYRCLDCHQLVLLRFGQIRLPYFAHQALASCQIFSDNESKEHVSGKYQLATYFAERGYQVELEQYLPKIKQRPDMMLLYPEKKQKFMIEYQCSPITIEYIKARNLGYQQMGLLVRWILGKPYQKKQLQDGTLAKFAQPIGANQIGICFWNTQKKQLFKIPWLKLDGQRSIKNYVKLKKLADLQIKQLLRQSKSFNIINNQLYQMHRSLWGIPWELHNFKHLTGGLKCSNTLALVQLYLFIEEQRRCTKDTLFDFTKTLPWYEFCSMDQGVVQRLWLDQVLSEWTNLKLVSWESNYWFLLREPTWFNHLDLKIMSLHQHNETLIGKDSGRIKYIN